MGGRPDCWLLLFPQYPRLPVSPSTCAFRHRCFNQSSCAARSGNLASSKGWSPTVIIQGLLNSTDARLGEANLVYSPYCTSDGWIGSATSETVGFPFTFNMLGSHVVDAVISELVQTHGMGSKPGQCVPVCVWMHVLVVLCARVHVCMHVDMAVPRCAVCVMCLPLDYKCGELFRHGCLRVNVFVCVACADTQYLYSGCSAGARGVLFNAPRVSALVRAKVPTLTNFGALLDSALWLDIAPLSPNAVPFAVEAQGVFALANVSSLLNPLCMAQYPTQGWKCLMGQYALPPLQATSIPFLVFAFQYDKFQLDHNWDLPFGQPPSTPQESDNAETFRATSVQHVKDVVVAAPSRARTAVLLPACFDHCSTQGTSFQARLTNGFSLQDAVVSWFFGGSATRFNIETCSGFNCGNGCQPAEL